MSVFGSSTGSPPFNPNAPDPREQGIPGLRNPAPQAATQRAAPRGPGLGLANQAVQQQPQLSQLERIGLSLGDFAAGFQGQQGPSQQLLQERQQQYRERQQQLLQAFQVAQQFGQFIDSGPVAGYEERKAKAREQYLKVYGDDSGDVFDSLVGSAALTPAMVADLEKDEYGKMVLAGGTVDQVRQYYTSKEGVEARRQRVDLDELPAVDRKFKTILGTKDPKVRAALAEALDNRRISPEELATLNDQLPDQLRFTRGELEIIRRQEDKFEEANPKTFESSGTVKAKRDAALKVQSQIEVDRAQQQAQADFGGGTRTGPTPNAQLEYLNKVQRSDGANRQAIAALDRALDERVDGVKDIELLYNFIARMDDTAAREGELALAQRAQSLRGRLQVLTDGLASGRLLSDQFRVQVREALLRTREDIEKDRQLVIGNARRVAEGLGSDPSVTDSLDALASFNADTEDAEAGEAGAPAEDEVAAAAAELERRKGRETGSIRVNEMGGNDPQKGVEVARRKVAALESAARSNRQKKQLATARKELAEAERKLAKGY